MAKNLFKKLDISAKNNQTINSLIAYTTLYGVNSLGLTIQDKLLINKYNVKYKKNFINNKCVWKNQKAKDLIKKLFELDVEKRIIIEMALNHSFLSDEKNEKNDTSEKIIESKQNF